ncbi:ATP-dependent RNA helicase DHX30-like [Choristoneura fumiferana]|uniref:ATP-dependent RNA helicase DHX30-like n=1 Tax=Choristoneura fumiferana TaxID=7141 RepID=UPI003D159E8E
MFLKSFTSRLSVYRNYVFSGANTIYIGNRMNLNRSYGYSSIISKHKVVILHLRTVIASKCQEHRCYSRGLLDGDTSDLQNAQKEKDLSKLSSLFPNPRVTLNELAAKCPSNVFDIHYKQSVVTPKGGRKKAVQNDWICIYTFVWPQKIKFEGTALSKRQAAEKAAVQALHWLYANKRIDDKGCPIFDKNVIDELNSSMQEHIKASISEACMTRIEKIWEDYDSEIKNIYNTTFEAAKRRVVAIPSEVTKDSTIDDDDELSGGDLESTSNEATDLSEVKMPAHPVYGRHISPPTRTALDRRKRQLIKAFERYDEQRTPLPIDEYSEQIAATLSASRVSVLVGAAGCGKSSRAPVAALRGSADATVLVAGPRRVAAIGLARRVASELGEQVADTVGYQVRLDSKPPRPPAGSILYCTSGILLRRLQTNPGLHGCTHVFIDEAHERDVNTDLSLLLLKRAVHLNPELRVVVMSATLDTEVFTRYFDSCPIIEVPGRTFPVQTSYLDDIRQKYNLELSSTSEICKKEDAKPFVNCQEVADVIKAVDRAEPEGAILVFLPGWAEIKQVKLLLDQSYADSTHMILPVHSRLSTTEQARMFSRPLPGVRKIVLATNIAETSITIPDVVFVVDSGAHKENRLVEGTGTASLESVWVSRAGARQRAGRAGRVQPGHCYKLYTKEKEDDFAPFTTPEILRVPLEQTVLDCKTYAPDEKVESFLSQLPEPPTQKAIQLAVSDLIDLGALTQSEQLTRLGSILSSLSVHPRLGLGLLWSPLVGNCVAAATCIAHAQLNVELFADAADRRDEIRERHFRPRSVVLDPGRVRESSARERTEGGGRVVREIWPQEGPAGLCQVDLQPLPRTAPQHSPGPAVS